MFRAGNTGAATALIEALDPLLAAAIIPLGQPDSMLRIQESLRRGEIVTLLADRSPAPHEGPGRDFLIDFLGAPALFPAGPMMLAAMMQVPVFLAFGLCTGKRHYEVHFEPFADALPAIPARRWAELRGFGERYAARLATLCREHPFNWFNFFMFWENAHASPDVTRAHAPAVAGRNPPTGHPGAAGPGLGS
jgi:predicted LPLAT superfamily acyltransferase